MPTCMGRQKGWIQPIRKHEKKGRNKEVHIGTK